MKKGENYNGPKKGSRTVVEPIRRLKDIQAISKLLVNNPRDHLLWVMGTNNGLRTGDILKLCVDKVNNVKVRNLSMKMRHLQQQFTVAPVRYLVTPVC